MELNVSIVACNLLHRFNKSCIGLRRFGSVDRQGFFVG